MSGNSEHTNQRSGKEFFRLVSLMKPEWKWLLLGVLCSVLTLAANAALLALAAWFLACMALAGASGIPFNYHLPAGWIRTLALVRTGGRYVERLITHQATFKLLSSLRVWFFRRLEPLAPAGLMSMHSGDVFSRITADIDSLDTFYLRCVLPAASALIVLSMMFIFVASCSLPVALHMACVWLLAGIVLPLYFQNKGFRLSREQVISLSSMRTKALDLISGLEELVVFGQSKGVLGDVHTENRNQSKIQAGLSRLKAQSVAGQALCVGIAVWGVLIVAIPLVRSEELGRADLPMLAVLALVSFESLQQLPASLSAWGGIQSATQRLWALIDQQPLVRDPAGWTRKIALDPGPGSRGSDHRIGNLQEQKQTLSGQSALNKCQLDYQEPPVWDITFAQVGFTYPGRTQPVFQGLSFTVKDKERLGIVGTTGSGKTSIINLLLRFYPWNQGSILVGGRPIEEFPVRQVRSWFGVIAQEPYLFNASIAENLLLADPNAREEDLHQALATAGLDGFVRSLPHTLDTQVGQAGLKLSGGQARRIGIARAVLKQAPIIILDEPSEGLDPETEAALWAALKDVLARKTVILLTHREMGLKCMHRVMTLPHNQ